MAMLRMVDMDAPCMGNIYEGIDQMLEQVKEILKEDNEGHAMYEEIQVLAQERWEMLHSPLHATAFVLNPKIQHRRQSSKHNCHNTLDDRVILQRRQLLKTCKNCLLLHGGRTMAQVLQSYKDWPFEFYLKCPVLQHVRGIGQPMASYIL